MKVLLRAMVYSVLLFAGMWSVFADDVVVIPIKGEISEARFFFLRRALKKAESENAKAVVLDMDTYGGELQAAVNMQKALAQSKARTLTYINPNAGSAGALIAVSTQQIYMAPVSAIGAAAPVGMSGEDIAETLKEKTVSYFSRYFRSVAEHNGHNPDIAQAFIDKDEPVKVGSRTIHEEGSVLTLSAQQATEKVDGKSVLAAGIADSIPDLLKQAKLDGAVQRIEPTGFEEAAFWITMLAPLFLLGGILGAWLEFKMPGLWLPGILSAICFTIFFTGHYLAGLAGWEAPVIFVIGLVLVIGELAVHPGTIIPGMVGAVLMMGSLLWAMIDRYPTEPWMPSSDALIGPVINLSVTLILALLAISAIAKYLPRTSFYGRLVLSTANPAGPAFSVGHSEFIRLEPGTVGVATSILRPSGKAEFGGAPYDVIADGTFIEPGTRLRVVAVEGARIVVQAVA